MVIWARECGIEESHHHVNHSLPSPGMLWFTVLGLGVWGFGFGVEGLGLRSYYSLQALSHVFRV